MELTLTCHGKKEWNAPGMEQRMSTANRCKGLDQQFSTFFRQLAYFWAAYFHNLYPFILAKFFVAIIVAIYFSTYLSVVHQYPTSRVPINVLPRTSGWEPLVQTVPGFTWSRECTRGISTETNNAEVGRERDSFQEEEMSVCIQQMMCGGF